MLTSRRFSRGHARQASCSMQTWLKRIALGAFLAALFVIQFVPGKENTANNGPGNSPGEDRPSRDGGPPVATPDADSPTPP